MSMPYLKRVIHIIIKLYEGEKKKELKSLKSSKLCIFKQAIKEKICCMLLLPEI